MLDFVVVCNIDSQLPGEYGWLGDGKMSENEEINKPICVYVISKMLQNMESKSVKKQNTNMSLISTSLRNTAVSPARVT